MNLKEIRTRNFPGLADCFFRFNNGDFIPVNAPEPGCGLRSRYIVDALTWVLFGAVGTDDGNNRIDYAEMDDCSVEVDFDNYSVHRAKRKNPSGMSVRLFEYTDYVFCCAHTVKELSAGKTEETQRLIEKKIGFSDPSGIPAMLKLQSDGQRS